VRKSKKKRIKENRRRKRDERLQKKLSRKNRDGKAAKMQES
jgi:hypothetical protein